MAAAKFVRIINEDAGDPGAPLPRNLRNLCNLWFQFRNSSEVLWED